MSLADQIFIDMCKDILANGTDTRGQKVRPRWEDGTPAYTIKKFGVCNRYDLRKEFPAITLRRTRFCGSGRESPTISMIFIRISGTSGRMLTVPSARLTVIR